MSPAAISPDGIEIRYDVAGSGSPAIVFVHGWSCDRTYWREQMTAFAARHLVVAIDLAGHGESGIGRASWTMPAFGDDTVAVVEQLGLERVVLVGHSMGGDVVTEAALRLGDRVAGVVWVDTYPTLDEVTTAEELDAFAEPFQRDFPGHTRQFVRGMFPPTADPALVERVAEDMASAPPDDRARRGSSTRGATTDRPLLPSNASPCPWCRSGPTTGRPISSPWHATGWGR